METTAKKIFLLALAGALAACAGPRPRSHALTAPPGSIPPNHTMNFPLPPREIGQWTVEDVLQDFGAYSVKKLSPYFAKAQVAYPPREVTLLGLKQEKVLELWARGDGEYRFIRSYDIQAASGGAGPKLRQGDNQVPEGIYRIVGLNPNSNYHLSMKLNYPNDFDLFHAQQEERFDPGSDIFIHGKAASVGCLAMGDEAIEELFVLVAQVGKENVKVVIAPYDPRITPLEGDLEGLPAWTPELYAMISREVMALTHPVNVSNSTSLSPPLPRLNR